MGMGHGAFGIRHSAFGIRHSAGEVGPKLNAMQALLTARARFLSALEVVSASMWLSSGRTDLKDFKRLEVWQLAHQLTLSIYSATSIFPKHELFGLTSQLRRSAASIGSNIAEGCGRGGQIEFNRFLQIAAGSCSEVEYQLLLARDLRYVPPDLHSSLERETQSVRRMLAALTRSIRNSKND
jgi:four helix bundle protein